MSNEIIEKWLSDTVASVEKKDYSAHMNLISERVSLQGVPGYENINYDAWAAQCKHEFDNDLFKSVQYQGLKIVAETEARIMFKTFETVVGADGTTNAQGVEILLELEDDQHWRLAQERILPDDETRHDGLLL